MSERRQGSVRATTVCFVFCLSREDLNTVLNQFPTLRAPLEARARERLQELYLSENRPLESILALFSDPAMDSGSVSLESHGGSELSDLLNSRENDTFYNDSENSPNQALYNHSSSLNIEDKKSQTPEFCHSVSPTSGTTHTQS